MVRCRKTSYASVFFINDTATTEIYTLSLHDALPIWSVRRAATCSCSHVVEPQPSSLLCRRTAQFGPFPPQSPSQLLSLGRDRKSTRLNSRHANISYAVFCLKKKTVAQHSVTHLFLVF